MSKADVIELEGIVTEKLPNTMFKVKLENGAIILAHIAESFARTLSVFCPETRLHWKCPPMTLQKEGSSGETSKKISNKISNNKKDFSLSYLFLLI